MSNWCWIDPEEWVYEPWETRLRRDDAERRAKIAIERDLTVVYDACACAGQIKNNLPTHLLFDIVARFLAGEL